MAKRQEDQALATAAPPAPWERQPDESDEAFAAFVLYRDAGPKRSTAKVSQLTGKDIALIHRWSSGHRWVGRVVEWTREQDRVGREAQLDEIREMRKRHVQIAMLMQTLGATELNKRAKTAQAQASPSLDTDEAQRVLEAGVKLERLSRGEPTDVQATQNDTTVRSEDPVEDFVTLMRDREYRKHLDAAARRAERMASKSGRNRK